jgi:hypothetical protein
VKRIVEAHGGTAGMRRSEDGAGLQTEFFLLIPCDTSVCPAGEREASLGVTS